MIKKRYKKLSDRFLKIRGNPKEIALGFALGLFVGMSPTMGVQMIIAVFLASIFKLNKIAAAIAVWISNPLTAPILYGFTYFVGSKMLFLKEFNYFPDEFSLSALLFMIKKAPGILGLMTLGGIVTGIPIFIAGYYFSYHTIIKYRKNIKGKFTKKIIGKKRKNN